MKRILFLMVCICSSFLNGCANSDEQLRSAIDNDNLEQLQKSLNSGANSRQALYYAVEQKQVNIARFLLSHGVNPNQSYSEYLVEELLAVDPKTNVQFALKTKLGEDGKSTIDMNYFDPNITSELLQGFAKGRFCYRYKLKSMPGRTPLYTAIDNNDIEMIRLLLGHGATVTEPYVIIGCNPNIGGPFLSRQTQINSILNGANVLVGTNFAKQDGDEVLSSVMPIPGKVATALEYARSKGKTALVQILESSVKPK